MKYYAHPSFTSTEIKILGKDEEEFYDELFLDEDEE